MRDCLPGNNDSREWLTPLHSPSLSQASPINSYRTIWISDFHLGTRACKAAALLDFLRNHEAETLYLVGDIFDGWNLGRSWYFDSTQQAVVEEIAAWADRGTYVEFLPGNHDEASLELIQETFGLRPGRTELVHRTADGRRMLVIHGHQFDNAVSSGRWFKASPTYMMALRVNQWYGRGWAERALQARSLSTYLRHQVKKVVDYFTDFDERAVFAAVRQHRADGIICGHIHRAEQRLVGPFWYINDGDWVESCTALVEDNSGALRLLRWSLASETRDLAEAGLSERSLDEPNSPALPAD